MSAFVAENNQLLTAQVLMCEARGDWANAERTRRREPVSNDFGGLELALGNQVHRPAASFASRHIWVVTFPRFALTVRCRIHVALGACDGHQADPLRVESACDRPVRSAESQGSRPATTADGSHTHIRTCSQFQHSGDQGARSVLCRIENGSTSRPRPSGGLRLPHRFISSGLKSGGGSPRPVRATIPTRPLSRTISQAVLCAGNGLAVRMTRSTWPTQADGRMDGWPDAHTQAHQDVGRMSVECPTV